MVVLMTGNLPNMTLFKSMGERKYLEASIVFEVKLTRSPVRVDVPEVLVRVGV